jgi:hypothetical protein
MNESKRSKSAGGRPSVLECDVDVVLARRLLSDKKFQNSFLGYVIQRSGVPMQFKRVGVDQQARHEGTSGTIDILVRLLGEKAEVGRLLIENKLDSSFTPTQPERYASSAVAMSRAGRTAIAVICAPEKYLARSKYLAPFRVSVSYEAVSGWLDGDDKALLLDAILRFEMPYEPDPVPAVADFHEGYAKLVQQIAPELIVKPNPNPRRERPQDSRTIYFLTKRTLPLFPYLPPLRFSHQCWDKSAPSASVKVMFGKWAKHEAFIRKISARTLGNTGIYVRKAGDSLGLVIDTPRLNNTQPVASQLSAVSTGIRAAAALRSWMFANESALADWVRGIANDS